MKWYGFSAQAIRLEPMPNRTKESRKDERWLAIESAVAVPEAGLAPGSRVQHDVGGSFWG